MAFLQAATVRSAFRSVRPTIARQTQRLGQSTRRGYASHIPSPKTSDAPWAIGAVVVTIPTCILLLRSSPPEAHHLHTPSHIPTHKHEREPEAKPESEPEKVEEKTEEKPEEKSQEKAEISKPDDVPASETPSDSDVAQASGKGDASAAEIAAEQGEQGIRSENKGYVTQNLTKSDEEKQLPSKRAGESKDPEKNA
ncbi:hypothetical protein F5884DRAFT_784003 [Xylogone sp. PMI_703]|nr:hypothetical protein F5884DRAFT_784003 [Xylogone sp. PMI_703]